MKPPVVPRIVIALSMVLAVCGSAGAQSQDVFSVNFPTTNVSFNPLVSYTTTEAQIYTALYEGLVTYDPYTLDPIPGTATRWEISDDGRTYRFTIRSSARYSNGDPVLAEHFRSTWLALLAPETGAPYASLLDVVEGARAYRAGENVDPDSVGIRAVEERVLEVRLETRATHLLRILSHHSFVTVHPDMLGRAEWSGDSPLVTSGPYIVESRTENRIELVRNERYWDRRNVDIGRLVLHFSDDFDEVTAAFNSGELNWSRGAIDLSAVERQESIVVTPLFATTYYLFSAREAPFDEARVRLALALLLPWEEIRSEQFQYLPTTTLVPSIPYYPEVEGISQADPDRAFELLSEAGYPDGEGLADITVTIPGGADNDRIAGLMAETWQRELGIEVTVETILHPNYFDAIERGEFTLSTMTWIGDFADPLTFLDMWTRSSNLNNSDYANPEFDTLVQGALGQTGSARYSSLARAEELLLWDAIVLPISNSPSVNLIDLDLVDGWYANALDVHPFKFLSFRTRAPLPNVALLSDTR